MHFVFLNQYYPPDAAPTGVMLEGVVEKLVRLGYDVTVICAEGEYAAVSDLNNEERALVSEQGIDSCLQKRLPKRKTKECAYSSELIDEEEGSGELKIVRIKATSYGRRSFIGKLIDYVSYYGTAAWKLATMQPRPDRVIALTTPPYLSVLARIATKLRGGDHAHWVMDLYPDVMLAHGILKEHGILFKLLALLARFGFGGSRCYKVVTLGPDMAERLGKYMDNGRNPEWVPLWGSGKVEKEEVTDSISSTTNASYGYAGAKLQKRAESNNTGKDFLQLRQDRGWRDDELVVMYSGNMGLGHKFEEIFDAAKLLCRENSIERTNLSKELGSNQNIDKNRVKLVFFGDGKRKKQVLDFALKHPDYQIEVHDYIPPGELRGHLQSADIHLASLKCNWTGTMVPSKLQGIFEVGRPVIFIGSKESSIGKWILESGGGWIVDDNDVQGLVTAINEGKDQQARTKLADAASNYADKHFSKETNVLRLVKLFSEMRN